MVGQVAFRSCGSNPCKARSAAALMGCSVNVGIAFMWKDNASGDIKKFCRLGKKLPLIPHNGDYMVLEFSPELRREDYRQRVVLSSSNFAHTRVVIKESSVPLEWLGLFD